MARRRGTTDLLTFDLVPDDEEGASHGDAPEGGPSRRSLGGRLAHRARTLRPWQVVVAAAAALLVAATAGSAHAVREHERTERLRDAPGGVFGVASAPAEAWRVSTDGDVLTVMPGGVVALRDGTEVVGVDAATGKERWRRDLGGPVRCGPTPAHPAEWADPAERLVCLGRVVGTTRTVTVLDRGGAVVAARDIEAPDGRSLNPAADGGLLVIERTGPVQQEFVVEDWDGQTWELGGLAEGPDAVVRLEDAATGEVRWERTVPFRPVEEVMDCAYATESSSVSGTGTRLVAVIDALHVVASSRLVRVDACGIAAAFTPQGVPLGSPPEGAMVWDAWVRPAPGGGFVLQTGGGETLSPGGNDSGPLAGDSALLDDDGNRVVDLPGTLVDVMATDGTRSDVLLALTPDGLAGFSRSGERLWQSDHLPSAVPVVADGVALVVLAESRMAAVDLVTGEDRWATEATVAGSEDFAYYAPWVQSAVTDGKTAVLVIQDPRGTGVALVALDLGDGTVRWELRRAGELFQVGAVDGNLLVFQTMYSRNEDFSDEAALESRPGALAGLGPG